jgi:carbon storage regulator
MLVLTRRWGEEIVIGDNIRVRILHIENNQIRIGIAAPPWVRVDRMEIHERRQAELVNMREENYA